MEVREPAIAYSKQKLSIEEYLEMENAADEKHEYYKGEIFAMSGAKMPHNRISSNLLIALGIKLKGKKCQPYGSDARIHIQSNTLFTYPDISIICGEVITLNDDDYNVNSFASVLLMWMSHHHIFKMIRTTNKKLVLVNGLLLMVIALVPFPTNTLGENF